MTGMSWLRLEGGKYLLRRDSNKQTTCQIEIEVQNYFDVISLPFEGEYSTIAPLRILSFDIECSAEKGSFPIPSQDPII